MAPVQQASAGGTAVEGAEDEGKENLAATTSIEAAGVAVTAATTRVTDAVAADSMASATRADTCGPIATNSLMVGPLLKARRVEEQEEGEEEAVEVVAVVEESGAAAKEQRKGEENPKAAAEEDYGESMTGAIASAAFSNPTSATGECVWLTLHRRMGHVALPILQQLVKGEMIAGIRLKGELDEVLGCPTCMQAKFTRFPFSSSEATAKAPLDKVVMDVVGPLKLGAAGAEYFLTIVDVYTRMTWVYVLSKKSDVAETVKTDWLPMVERQ
ncbi:unnamed protein product [Closterium sp. NIES-53]